MQLSELMSPYNELWADAVAVTTLKNLKAMRYLDSDHIHGQFRDFSHSEAAANWTETDPHLLLTPVRSYLGRNQLAHVHSMSDTERRNFLVFLFQSIGQELVSRKVGDQLSVPEVNLRLMKRLEGKSRD